MFRPRSRLHVATALALSAFAPLGVTGCAPVTDAATDQAQASAPESPQATSAGEFEALEERYDARLGVYAIDTGTGQTVQFRADERFAFASTYKALAAAAVLQQHTLDELDQVISYGADDLVTYSPVTEAAIGTGMRLREIAAAAVQHSDNTAGNLLFDQLGGPEGFDAALAKLGDEATVAVREETSLNVYTPGDDRDTSTPRALATDLSVFVLGDVLDEPRRDLLVQWLRGNTTGDALIRAGVPDGWIVGDKTGAATYGTRNDIAVLWPSDGAPIVLAVLSDKDEPEAEYDDALIADAAARVVDLLRS